MTDRHGTVMPSQHTTHGPACAVLCCAMLQLTRLLEDSLGGSSKTLLVVNCRCGNGTAVTQALDQKGSSRPSMAGSIGFWHSQCSRDSPVVVQTQLSSTPHMQSVWCVCLRSPASENVAETKCSLDFATRARKVELGAAVKASEAGSGGGAPGSNPGSSSGRDSPAPGSPSRPSQVHTGGSSGGGAGSSGSGSAAGSPRVSGRYSAGPSELRQTISRRAAAKEDK